MQFRIVPALLFAVPLLSADTATKIDFSRDIQPIFQQRCAMCHGAKTHLSGLRLDDRESAKRVIQPGKASESRLIQMVKGSTGKVMPPVGPKLTDAQIALIAKWIDQGANWPAAASAAPHWAWQPVAHPAPPAVKRADWPANDIDRFVLARLEKENIAPSPEADRATLLRRLSLDLTGLPPAPQEIADFIADTRPDAYAREVDRLLASPHYGEKWARYWLDLAHYADSDGYEKDLVRPWAWRYRDWVINAFNRDLPFDQFTIQQIAGDLLPKATIEQQVATGFLRNTLTNREAGVDRREARFEQLIDRTNTVGTVWMGLTVGCAQCHNHKFDPISQKDYYQFFAFFNSAEEEDIDAPLPGELGAYLRARPEYDRKRLEILEQHKVAELQARWESRIRQAFADPGKDLEWDFAVTEMRAAFDGADRFLKGEWTKRTQRQADRLTDYFVAHYGPEFERDKTLGASLKEARDKLNQLKGTLPALTQAPVIVELPNAPAANLHIGGDALALGPPVDPAVPSVLPPLPGGWKPNRLALARWLVS